MFVYMLKITTCKRRIYKHGRSNKDDDGKEGKTSWDSFSYAIQMAHNVWSPQMQYKKQTDNTTMASPSDAY